MKPSVLIVDDSLKVRMDLRDILGAGFTVTACDTLEAARTALACRSYELVILDPRLQDGHGLDLLRLIRSIDAKRRPRVIVLSEDAATKSRVRGLRAGADIYVGKPYDGAYLLARACELVHIKDATKGAPSSERRPSSARKGTPIKMLTASADEGAKREGLRAGADELVAKTPELELLKGRLRALLHRKRDENDLRAADHAGEGNNGPWRAQDDVPPGCLVFHAIVETGVSSIIGPRTMARVCERAGVNPRTSSIAEVERTLPALREALGIFLPSAQVEKRIAAVSAFLRQAGGTFWEGPNAAASSSAPVAEEKSSAAKAKKRHSKPVVKPASAVVAPAAEDPGARDALLREFERLQSLLTEERSARARAERAIAELKALRRRPVAQKPAAPSPASSGNGERKTAAAADNEWGYRSLADAIPCALCAARPDGAIDYVNHHLADFLGLPVSKVLATPWRDFIHPSDIETAARIWSGAVAAGTPFSFEVRVRRHDSAYRWVLVEGSPVHSSSGAVIRWFGAATDIDDLKRAQARTDAMGSDALLARAAATLSASLDIDVTLHNLARVVVPDLADLCIVFLSSGPSGVRIATVAHVDPTKADLIRALSEGFQHRPDAPHGYRYVLRTGEPDIVPVMTDEILVSMACSEEHLRLLRELKSTSGVVVPLPASGQIIGAMMLLNWESGHRFSPADVPVAEEIGRYLAVAIGHAKDFEAEKQERTRAEEANRVKDEFLAMVSHELRTPLSAVLGWTRMLRTGKVDAPRTEKALAMIERNTLAQAQLIEDLLDVGRIVAGKLRLTICPANLPQLIEAAVESMRPAAEAREITLEAQVDPEAGPVMGDAGRLQQIAFNLINNAVKFTPRQGRVNILLRRSGRHIELVVEDTGRGITPDFLPHIFERFRQAATSVSRSKGGLGLGLAIVKRLVELHGGSIDARSEGEGKGATLTVQLPVAPLRVTEEDADPSARPSWPPSEGLTFDCRPALEGLSVLVVDDEPDAVRILCALLEQSKARVLTAGSAAEAMSIVEESRPDVVLSDVAMPGEDGHTFVRRLRALPRERGGLTPAIALTAFNGAADRERSLQSGFDVHISKPVEPSELILAIATAAAPVNA